MRLSGFSFCIDFYFSLVQKLNILLSEPVHWNGYFKPTTESCLKLTETLKFMIAGFLTQVLKSMTADVHRVTYLYGVTVVGTGWTVRESNPGGGRNFPHPPREALGPT
jgi:hypothetical protein